MIISLPRMGTLPLEENEPMPTKEGHYKFKVMSPLRPGLLLISRFQFKGVNARLEQYTEGWIAWVNDHCVTPAYCDRADAQKLAFKHIEEVLKNAV